MVREAIVGDGRPRVSGHIAYRAVLPTPEVPQHLQRWDMVLWAGPKCHLVHYPLRSGELYNLVAVFHSGRYEEGWNSYGDPKELRERFKDTCDDVRTMLGKISEWRMWVLCDREPIKEWSKGRVTLLGDAAHPMLQYLAQGAGMALEDSLCLAKCLDEADNVEAAFAAYPLPEHGSRAIVGARLWRILSRRRRAPGIAQRLRQEPRLRRLGLAVRRAVRLSARRRRCLPARNSRRAPFRRRDASSPR
jgi:salicylate hydroxylase